MEKLIEVDNLIYEMSLNSRNIAEEKYDVNKINEKINRFMDLKI